MGPIPLPTAQKKFVVTTSPHVDKNAREHFQIMTHKRLIDIETNNLIHVLFNDTKKKNENNVKDVNDKNCNNISSTETIELDKLLSGDGDSKKFEIPETNEKKNYKIEDLKNMSIKQLKDLAKVNKIKSVGNKTKIELIEILTNIYISK